MHELQRLLLASFTVLFAGAASAQEDGSHQLDIEVGKSIVLETPMAPSSVGYTDTEVLHVEQMGEITKYMIQGREIGTTDFIVEYEGLPPTIYEVTVHRDMSELIRRIEAIVEGEPPQVYPLEGRIVVEGAVDDLDTLEQVALVAQIYDEAFVNLMTVRGDHQVQLEVIFAEVSRSGLRDLGLNVLWGDTSLAIGAFNNAVNGGARVLHTRAPNINEGVVTGVGSGTFNLIGWASAIDLAAVMSILDEYNLGKVLAQPTLVALSGQQSEFLAGGEVPVPAAAGLGSIAINYREFGIKLVFVPTVLAGEVIDVRMSLEVSEPDFAIGTRVTGIEVPGFVSRKGNTHLRIESGKTFAVAGLLSESTTYLRSGVPGLSQIPLLGALFRRVRHVRDENEVVIYVTPRLVRPLAPGQVPAPPGTTENNNPSDLELFLLGADRRLGSRTSQPTGAVGLQR